jgi:putative transposase
VGYCPPLTRQVLPFRLRNAADTLHLMPEYRRAFQPGGMFFFTLVTHHRRPLFANGAARALLGQAFRLVRSERPFEVVAIVLLPDHLHCLLQLPENDADFSTRWAKIKWTFSHSWIAAGGKEAQTSESRAKHRERAIWQRRFWEHTIQDERDMIQHIEYIHYNPVKHELAACPHAWLWSSFESWVRQGVLEPNWGCTCGDLKAQPPCLDGLDSTAME